MDVKTEMALIAGTPVQLGRKVYICPALNIKAMKAYKDDIALIQKGLPAEKATDQEAIQQYFDIVVKLLTAALQRNYPSVDEDTVADGVDYNNLKRITLAVLGASGFVTTDEQAGAVELFGKQEPGSAGESTGTA
jgi:hypothetical protein